MGTYGFVRFSLPLFPDASVQMIPMIVVLSIIMVIYTAMVAFAQKDMKQVIAYSSVSHMGIIMIGTFAMNAEGISGAVFQMLSHGMVSGALFLLVGIIYDRTGTKIMDNFGGIASIMPVYATIFGCYVDGFSWASSNYRNLVGKFFSSTKVSIEGYSPIGHCFKARETISFI